MTLTHTELAELVRVMREAFCMSKVVVLCDTGCARRSQNKSRSKLAYDWQMNERICIGNVCSLAV